MILMDEVRPELGTNFNGMTAVKLGALGQKLIAVDGLAACLVAQACGLVCMLVIGKMVENHPLALFGCGVGLVIAGLEILSGELWPTQMVLCVELIAEICSQFLAQLSRVNSTGTIVFNTEQQTVLLTLSSLLAAGPAPVPD